ncbi:hypothetical protein KW783_03815 [Candidatus Parcubacteria bacterium]|nr:hypothetical protein [Candidatus Parcubacteria bacterium]
MLEIWRTGLRTSFNDLGNGVVTFVPNLIIAIVIVVIGWAVGALLGKVVAQIVKSLRVDEALRHTGVEDVVRRGGMKLNIGLLLGTLVKWFIIIVFMVAAFNVLGLSDVNMFLQQVVLVYLPHVIVAILILLVAAVIAEAMQRIVVHSARTAQLPSAHFLGGVTKWAIWIFAFLVALSQLGIAVTFIQTLFTGVIIALSLAVGLAFGLGGQDAASRYIEKMRNEIANKDM